MLPASRSARQVRLDSGPRCPQIGTVVQVVQVAQAARRLALPVSATPFLRTVFALAVASVLAMSCNSKTETPRSRAPTAPARQPKVRAAPVIYTTTYPMKYFAERIGRDKVRVHCPVPADPEAFLRTISHEIIEGYQKADLIVVNGAGYENWIDVVCLPESVIVDTAKPFENEFLELETITHAHGEGGRHTHRGTDGHTWLDPVYATIQAGEIRKAMVRHFPAHAAAFEEGFASLARDLAELDRRFRDLSKAYDGRAMLASHPSYNYLANRYNWNVVNLGTGLSRTEMPDDRALAEIARVLRRHPARYILWEEYPTEAIAAGIEETLGLRSVEVSPCRELREEDARDGLDYLGVMQRNVGNIAGALTEARNSN